MSRAAVRPYLITKQEDGDVRLTVRETRYNSQGYPLVSANMLDERFKTAAAARNHAKEQFGAVAGEFEIPRAKSEG
jgi:hypothetical protein